MNKRAVKIKFDLGNSADDEKQEPNSSSVKKRHFKFSFTGTHKQSNSVLPIQRQDSNDDLQARKQKAKLIEYLNTEKPIVKKKVEIDHKERLLLDSLSDTPIDIEDYLKLPQPKAKDKLWKIPYYFQDNSDLINLDGSSSPASDRFGEGVDDGCTISINLPTKVVPKTTTKPKSKTWDEILDISDQVLEQFENAKWSRLTRTRRGSILQPRHVFLTPNPEVGCGEKFLMSSHFLSLRDWASELFLDSKQYNTLLDVDYKQNICKNTSMDDLSHMLFPDLKSSFSNYHTLTNSELQYIQTVSSRRRQSLVPPNLETYNDLSFRRQSFAGGQLWSTKLEINHQREAYKEKIKLINPDYAKTLEFEQDSSSYYSESDSEYDQETDHNDYPDLTENSKQRARLFAHELTLIVRQYFISIKVSEIVNFMTHSGQNILNSCANIKGLLHFQNRILRLIATYILKEDELENRVKSILFFIQVIKELYKLGNWHSVNLVTQSLQCPPIVRLKETWRKITFNYADNYCYFIQISEDLLNGKQLQYYEANKKFIPIFDDVIEQIKERCGLKIVQINQHRLHTNWDKLKNNDIVLWVSNEVDDLKKGIDLQESSKNEDFSDGSSRKSYSRQSSDSGSIKKTSFFHKILNFRRSNSKKKNLEFSEIEDPSWNATNTTAEELEEENHENIYQRRLLAGNTLIRPPKDKKAVPSCKQFWSITEFNKLKDSDKELIKQEIVRTLVAFQKKTFYVFEDRDGEIKDFLLNSKCNSMDACMQRSRLIEGDVSKKDFKVRIDANQSPTIDRRDHQEKSANEQVTPDNSDDDAQEIQQVVAATTRRRVMFAAADEDHD